MLAKLNQKNSDRELEREIKKKKQTKDPDEIPWKIAAVRK